MDSKEWNQTLEPSTSLLSLLWRRCTAREPHVRHTLTRLSGSKLARVTLGGLALHTWARITLRGTVLRWRDARLPWWWAML
jgi:hypothetical protein